MITADLKDSKLHMWIESFLAESTGLPLDVRLRYDNHVQQIFYASIESKLHRFSYNLTLVGKSMVVCKSVLVDRRPKISSIYLII